MTRPRDSAPDDHDESLPDEAAGRLAAAIAPVAPAPERAALLRHRVLARVRAEQTHGAVPRDALVISRTDDGEWQTILPGVARRILFADPGGDVQSYLLRLEPGAVVPRHEHRRDEECVVLEGELRVGDHVFRRGDWHMAPRGVDHEPIRSDGGTLLFLRGEIL